MSSGPGPGRRGSYHSRTGGASTPSGPRRPGRGGNNDNVLPLITGVLGSSILAFSLYVLSQKPGVFGADGNHPSYVGAEHACYAAEPICSSGSCPNNDESEPCPYYASESSKINLEKRKWLTQEEEAMVKDSQPGDQGRGRLHKELKHHLRRVKELTEELERDEQAKKRNWGRNW